MNMMYVGETITRTDAENCLAYAMEIACKYYFCTLADIRDLLGLPSEYTSNKVKFTIEQLKKAVIKLSGDCRFYDIYIPVEDAFDLSKPYKAESYTQKTNPPHIDIFMNRGHWVATINDKFFCTGDNFTEVTTELENYMNRKED